MRDAAPASAAAYVYSGSVTYIYIYIEEGASTCKSDSTSIAPSSSPHKHAQNIYIADGRQIFSDGEEEED